jgi:hypothetical protein
MSCAVVCGVVGVIGVVDCIVVPRGQFHQQIEMRKHHHHHHCPLHCFPLFFIFNITAAAPASKPKATDAPKDDRTVLMQYLEAQNRPYSVIQLHDNLHGAIKKERLSVLVEKLTDTGAISCKEFGKSKIYYALQKEGEVPQDELVYSFLSLFFFCVSPSTFF